MTIVSRRSSTLASKPTKSNQIAYISLRTQAKTHRIRSAPQNIQMFCFVAISAGSWAYIETSVCVCVTMDTYNKIARRDIDETI